MYKITSTTIKWRPDRYSSINKMIETSKPHKECFRIIWGGDAEKMDFEKRDMREA